MVCRVSRRVNQFYRKIGPEKCSWVFGTNGAVRFLVLSPSFPTPHCTSHILVYEINMLMEKWDQLINGLKNYCRKIPPQTVLVKILLTIYNLQKQFIQLIYLSISRPFLRKGIPWFVTESSESNAVTARQFLNLVTSSSHVFHESWIYEFFSENFKFHCFRGL